MITDKSKDYVIIFIFIGRTLFFSCNYMAGNRKNGPVDSENQAETKYFSV